MATLNQKIRWINNVYYYKWRRPKLKGSPQRKCMVLRLRICTPRKPNSAKRPVAKLRVSSGLRALAHIPGAGHNLRRHSRTLISGTGARDVPVVNYTCIRGVYDFAPLYSKKKRRSIYGVKQALDSRTFVRRKERFKNTHETVKFTTQ